MNFETIVFVGLICVSLAPLLVVLPRNRRVVGAGVLAALMFGTVLYSYINSSGPQPSSIVQSDNVSFRPAIKKIDRYVGSDTCKSCHPHQHATWHASFHRTMTQIPGPDSIAGPFDGVELESYDHTFKLERRGDEFWVDMEDPYEMLTNKDAPRIQRQIALVTGSHHMQVYWYAIDDRAPMLSMLPWVYSIEFERWIPRDAAFVKPRPDHLNVEMGRWNTRCIACHATHGRVRTDWVNRQINEHTYLREVSRVDTQVAEYGISCEACHGPGEHHVETMRDPMHRYQHHLGDEQDQTITIASRMPADRSMAVCGQCHSLWKMSDREIFENVIDHGFSYRPGDKFSRSKALREFDPNKKEVSTTDAQDVHQTYYWPDGSVRIAGREYNGLLDSPCYKKGGKISCLNCHNMHQATDDSRPIEQWTDDQLIKHEKTNDACTDCHQEYKKDSALAAHTHHDATSAGSNCYNCHMPFTSYGLLKAVRTHTIDSPNVATTVETGRPNGCNQCHLDKTLGWTANRLNEWYEIPKPKLSDDQKNIAATILWTLEGDAGQRSLAAWTLGWKDAHKSSGRDWIAPYLAELLSDPYEAIRLISLRSLQSLDGFEEADYKLFGTEKAQRANRSDVLSRWKKRKHDLSQNENLLLRSDGTIDREKFEQLKSKRDNRPIFLGE